MMDIIIKQWLINSLLILISVMGIVSLQSPFLKISDEKISDNEYRKIEKKEKLQLTLMGKIPSLGFDNLIADFIYLNFIQYYGDTKAREITGYELLPQQFETIVNRDPRFVSAYFLLEPATTLFAGKPQVSAKLITQALEKVKPTQTLAYQLWLYKGILQILFLNDLEGAKYSYTMAADWARQENTESSLNSALLAESMVKFLQKEPDNRKITGSAWLTIFLNARDEQTREIAREEINKLGGKIEVKGNFITVKFPES